jgi:prepilin-type N-terminal cleavage/methylation domain-containing protein
MNRRSGFSLIEVLTYIAVLTVVMALAYPAYDRCQRASRDLHRNADDIVRALRVGERWRKDVRAATGPIRASAVEFVIPQRNGDIIYRFTDGNLFRITNHQSPVTVISNVKASAMRADARDHVSAWRWELELAGRQTEVKVRPLFSFIAVAEVRP